MLMYLLEKLNILRSIYTPIWLWRLLLGTSCNQTSLLLSIHEKISQKINTLTAPKIVCPLAGCKAGPFIVFFFKSFLFNSTICIIYYSLYNNRISVQFLVLLKKSNGSLSFETKKRYQYCGLSKLSLGSLPILFMRV